MTQAKTRIVRRGGLVAAPRRPKICAPMDFAATAMAVARRSRAISEMTS